jgi:hypothetical protein
LFSCDVTVVVHLFEDRVDAVDVVGVDRLSQSFIVSRIVELSVDFGHVGRPVDDDCGRSFVGWLDYDVVVVSKFRNRSSFCRCEIIAEVAVHDVSPFGDAVSFDVGVRGGDDVVDGA